MNYGFSFGSKKVNMGPAFLNLKIMCKCLAKAIMKHLIFSKGKYLFLEDLQNSYQDIDVEFSYKFKKNLKLGNIQSPKSNDHEESKQSNLDNFKEIESNLRK